MTALEQDRAARALACREFTRPVVLVAGAGTGKTTALVARAVTWFLGPGWDEAAERETTSTGGERHDAVAARCVDALLAITFTKAAAAEMDERVRKALRKLESGGLPTGVLIGGEERPPGADERERAHRLRLAIDRPLATTIHGFCQALLAAHPAQAGLAPDFQVDADAERIPDLARGAVEADLAAAFDGRRDEGWLLLARDGVGPDRVTQCVSQLRAEGVAAAELDEDPTTDARLDAFLSELEQRARAFARIRPERLAAIPGVDAVQRAVASYGELVGVLQARDPVNPGAALQALGALELRDLLKKLLEWAKGKWGVKVGAVLGDGVDDATCLASELLVVLRPLARLDIAGFRARRAIVRRVLAQTESLGASEGVLTYGDLLTRAADLVEREPGLAARLRRRYRQILVDEFQDTDAVQCRLVRALALQGEGQRPGLFLVGDPKQSIYGWRGADLAAYDAFVDEVLAAGGERGTLVRNFRSTPAVLAAVTRLIDPVMKKEHGLQPEFQPLVANDESVGPEPEIWITWEPRADAEKPFGKTTVDVAARHEAALLARELAAEKARGQVEWKDMAVLVRSRSRLDVALEALRAADIPFQVEGDRSYYRRREVLDACALLGAIADPGDTLSLLAYLRSSACGLPDAALESLWQQDFPALCQELGRAGADDIDTIWRIRRMAEDRQHALASAQPPGGRAIPEFAAALTHALESLAVLRRSLHLDPADVFLETVRTLVLLEPAESARYQGRYRAANLERFFRRLGEELDSHGDAQALVRALRRAVSEGRDQRDARPQDQVENAVRFLTIHASKGLEFDSVFLIGLARTARRGNARADAFDRASGEQRLLGLDSPGWWRIAESSARRESAELARLLYVATTRTKRHLRVSAVWKEEPELRAPTKCQSFRDLAQHGVPADLARTARAMLDERRLEFPLDGFQVRLAIEEQAQSPRAAPAAVDGSLLARARADAARLDALLPLAALRRERVRVAGPSSGTKHDVIDAPRRRRALPRTEAQVAGTLVHAGFEMLPDLGAARARIAQVADDLAATEAATNDALALLERASSGPIGARLAALGSRIVARELALIAPAGEHEDGPLEAYAGSADLVYRDGEHWVVVDFKTEALGGVAATEAARRHAPQLDVYARALREALDLPETPRREVWYLREGVVAELA